MAGKKGSAPKRVYRAPTTHPHASQFHQARAAASANNPMQYDPNWRSKINPDEAYHPGSGYGDQSYGDYDTGWDR